MGPGAKAVRKRDDFHVWTLQKFEGKKSDFFIQ
jgi:hypothetical protein